MFGELSTTKPSMSSKSQDTARSKLVLAILMMVGLAACGHDAVRRTGDRPPVPVQAAKRQTVGEQAVAVAMAHLGVPYRYGGSSADGFDCSGLTQFAYRGAGIRIPRTTNQQWRALSPVPSSKIAVGDVLFFEIDGSISHVGMYIGRGRFVHAPSSGRTVSIASLNAEFYRRAFVRGGRP